MKKYVVHLLYLRLLAIRPCHDSGTVLLLIKRFKKRHPCRGGNTADAMGWLILGPMDAGGTGEGYCAEERKWIKRTHTKYPGSGPP